MKATKRSETEAVLRSWRTRILNVLLVVLAVGAVPTTVMAVPILARSPGQWPFAVIMLVALVAIAAMAAFRRLDPGLRASTLLVVGYGVAAANLVMTGMEGAGPWYLLAAPIVALILIGVRSGILTAVFGFLVAAVYVILLQQGVVVPAVTERDPVIDLATLGMLMAMMMALFVLFYRFLLKSMEDQRRTAGELVEARALVEEQNRTLELRIGQRTDELKQATHEAQREKLYSEALIQNSCCCVPGWAPAWRRSGSATRRWSTCSRWRA